MCRMPMQAYSVLAVLALICGRIDGQGDISAASCPRDTAALISVSREVQELEGLQQTISPGTPQQWRLLALHQQIYEHVTAASLQVDATRAAIDNEIARSTEVRGFLADKRDRNVTRANLLRALLGGRLGR